MKNMDQDAHGREQVEVNSTIKEPQSTGENNSVDSDGIDRRNFLSCMAWAGTGLLWTVAGGVPTSRLFAATGALASQETHSQNNASLTFVQISDSHIGFNKAANQDVTGTFKLALDKINRLPNAPDLLLHTGDITHSSKTMEFDTAQQLIMGTRAGEKFFVPGEHDTASDDGAAYLERFGNSSGPAPIAVHFSERRLVPPRIVCEAEYVNGSRTRYSTSYWIVPVTLAVVGALWLLAVWFARRLWRERPA